MENYNVILEKLNGIERLFNEKFDQNAKEHKAITSVLEGKANKWVEKLTKGVIGSVLVAVVGAIMGLILIKPAMYTFIYFYKLIV